MTKILSTLLILFSTAAAFAESYVVTIYNTHCDTATESCKTAASCDKKTVEIPAADFEKCAKEEFCKISAPIGEPCEISAKEKIPNGSVITSRNVLLQKSDAADSVALSLDFSKVVSISERRDGELRTTNAQDSSATFKVKKDVKLAVPTVVASIQGERAVCGVKPILGRIPIISEISSDKVQKPYTTNIVVVVEKKPACASKK